MSASPAERTVALPLARLLAAAWIGATLVAGAWLALAAVLDWEATTRWSGPAAAGATAVASTLHLVILRPWIPRSLLRWPMIWIAGSFLRLAMTLGATFLLYSATPYRGEGLWFAMAAAYVAVLYGETRVYASTMKRLAPPAERPAERPPDA